MRSNQEPRLRHLLLVAVLPLVLSASACGAGDERGTTATTVPPPAPVQDEGAAVERFDEPTGPVRVPLGQVFEIALRADAEDCYAWALEETDTDVVTLESSRPSFRPGIDEPDVVTGSDESVFTFTASAIGSVSLTFTEQSPCPDSPDRDRTTVEVEVE